MAIRVVRRKKWLINAYLRDQERVEFTFHLSHQIYDNLHQTVPEPNQKPSETVLPINREEAHPKQRS